LVGVHGLFVSDSPCMSVPNVSIVSISVAISKPLLCLFLVCSGTQNG